MNLSISDAFKNILNIAEKAFKKLHENKGYKPTDLKNTKEYQDLINGTNNVLNLAVDDNVVDGVLLSKLQKDVFLFSGLKTHAQLFEASRGLLDATGKIKSYEAFAKDFNAKNIAYNQTYLEAEYQYATSAATMADKWNSFDDTDRYNLQYRTANDNRVRDEHAALNEVTLPKDDAFWNSYYPPNGWRCRCTAVEVLKDKYPQSDSAASSAKGEKATTQIGKDGKNRLEIFRFNTGKEKVIFPPSHPYMGTRCSNGKLSITGLIGAPVFILSAEKSKCEAAQIVKEIAYKKSIKNSRTKTKEALFNRMKNGSLIFDPKLENANLFKLSKGNIKTLVSHFHPSPIERDNFIINIERLAKKGKYIGWAEDQIINGKQKHPGVNYWQYYEYKIGNEKSYLSVKLTKEGDYNPYSIDAKKDFKKIKGLKRQNPIR